MSLGRPTRLLLFPAVWSVARFVGRCSLCYLTPLSRFVFVFSFGFGRANTLLHKCHAVGALVTYLAAVFRSSSIDISTTSFPEGHSPEDFIEREEPPIHRNQLLARTMYYSEDIEGFATGLKRLLMSARLLEYVLSFKRGS